MEEPMKTSIYSLNDPYGNIRYIGKTAGALQRRLLEHLSETRRGISYQRHRWIRHLLSKNDKPSIVLIETVDGNGAKEEIAHIKRLRLCGIQLVNGTTGGDNAPPFRVLSEASKARWRDPQMRSRMIAALSLSKRGHSTSVETRQKLSAALKGNQFRLGTHHSDATKRKISKSSKNHTLPYRVKMSTVKRGHLVSAIARAKMSATKIERVRLGLHP